MPQDGGQSDTLARSGADLRARAHKIHDEDMPVSLYTITSQRPPGRESAPLVEMAIGVVNLNSTPSSSTSPAAMRRSSSTRASEAMLFFGLRGRMRSAREQGCENPFIEGLTLVGNGRMWGGQWPQAARARGPGAAHARSERGLEVSTIFCVVGARRSEAGWRSSHR